MGLRIIILHYLSLFLELVGFFYRAIHTKTRTRFFLWNSKREVVWEEKVTGKILGKIRFFIVKTVTGYSHTVGVRLLGS